MTAKIAVLIKQCPDTETKAQINDSGLSEDGVKFILNPYDEYAIEEALLSKSKIAAESVSVFTVGPARATEALRSALAMGCDDAYHVEVSDQEAKAFDSYLTAKTLSKALNKSGEYTCLFAGKQAIDDDSLAVPQMLAQFLDITHVSVVNKLSFEGEKNFKANRSIEGGAEEIIEGSLPALFSANKGLNKPRYASLPNIMKAKKKTINKLSLQDLGISTDMAKIQSSSFELPPEKNAGVLWEGSSEELASKLVSALKNEAKVI